MGDMTRGVMEVWRFKSRDVSGGSPSDIAVPVLRHACLRGCSAADFRDVRIQRARRLTTAAELVVEGLNELEAGGDELAVGSDLVVQRPNTSAMALCSGSEGRLMRMELRLVCDSFG